MRATKPAVDVIVHTILPRQLMLAVANPDPHGDENGDNGHQNTRRRPQRGAEVAVSVGQHARNVFGDG